MLSRSAIGRTSSALGLCASLVSFLSPFTRTAHAQTDPPAGAQPAAEAPADTAPAPAAEASPPAADAPPAPADAPPGDAPPPPKPPPYSLPFQLRPVSPVNVIRSDSTLALYESPVDGKSGSTIVSTLLGSYKVTEQLSPLVRLGMVSSSPPAPGESATGFLNPVLGALYGIKLGPDLRLGLFLGVTVPVGSGGGNDSTLKSRAANGAGILARAAMDNAMFAVNDFTVFPGVDFAYVAHGFTAQVEATVLQLTRVRGDAVQRDSSKTNFTTGIHLGYFFVPMLSAAAELRHQRWLSTPRAVEADGSLRDTTTFAFGPRVHIKVGEKMWLRPAVSFAVPLDDPMKKTSHKLLQLDIPFVF